jgi:hypothetical protein
MPHKLHNAYQHFIINRDQRLYYQVMCRLFHKKPFFSCNMNCSGCSHFSPLADRVFADIEQYERDMKQLNHLIKNIKVIRLLGGEPLLHPQVSMFFDSTRNWFPKADIRLTTNGILLSSMPGEFWESCRRNTISIDVTLYPPVFSKESDIVKLAKTEGTKPTVRKCAAFRVPVNSKGGFDPNRVFRGCRKIGFWPVLKHGKIYTCAKTAFIHYFNKAFGTNIPNTGCTDLYDSKTTGWEVLSKMGKPSETCSYCTYGWEKVPTQVWTESSCSRKEWDVAKNSQGVFNRQLR